MPFTPVLLLSLKMVGMMWSQGNKVHWTHHCCSQKSLPFDKASLTPLNPEPEASAVLFLKTVES